VEFWDCDVGGAELWGQALWGDEQSGGELRIILPKSCLTQLLISSQVPPMDFFLQNLTSSSSQVFTLLSSLSLHLTPLFPLVLPPLSGLLRNSMILYEHRFFLGLQVSFLP
jgi:hypothetical protein